MSKPPTDVVIYHNPACGTSRNTLALIRSHGHEPTVIEYLKTPPGRAGLTRLLTDLGMRPRELIRTKGDLYVDLQLADPKWTDDQLIDFLVSHPVLMERPIVVTARGTRVCRPMDKVLEILPPAQRRQ